MKFRPLAGLVAPLVLSGVLAVSCTSGTPQLMPMEVLFPLELGTLEDQIDLFQRPDQGAPERNRFLFYNGLVLVSDGNARKVMEFSSYGDLLTLFYNPDTNPLPALAGGNASTGQGQVQNRRAFAHPFEQLGEIALTDQNQLFVEDRVPAERRTFDPDLGAVLESRILRFSREGKFLDFLGQEGIGGTPFPPLERLTVTATGEVVVICRTGKGWAVWWYDALGNVVGKTVLSQSSLALPLPEGAARESIPQLEAVFADLRDRRLHVKIDYYLKTVDSTTMTDSGFQPAQSRIWTYDLATQAYKKSYALPLLKRQKTKDDSDPWGDRPFEFVGVSEGGLGFFLSSPENGSLRFLVCRPDGSTALERNIELDGADALFSQYAVTRSGILVGFLSDGNRALVAWWRSDSLLGTYAQTGF